MSEASPINCCRSSLLSANFFFLFRLWLRFNGSAPLSFCGPRDTFSQPAPERPTTSCVKARNWCGVFMCLCVACPIFAQVRQLHARSRSPRIRRSKVGKSVFFLGKKGTSLLQYPRRMVLQHHFISAVYAYQEGVQGYDIRALPLCDWDSSIDRQMQRELKLRTIANWLVYFLLFVPFFETPLWCWGSANGAACTKKSVMQRLLFSQLPHFEVWITAAFDVALLIGILLWGLMRARLYLGNSATARSWFNPNNLTQEQFRLNTWRLVILLIALGESVYVLCMPPAPGWRLVPFLRPVIFVLFAKQRVMYVLDAFRSLRAVVYVIFLLVLWIVVIAWTGLLIFNGTAEGAAFFPDLADSFANVYTMMTASNFPDVAVSSMLDLRVSVVFFVCGLVIGIMLLTSVLLGTLYNANKGYMKDTEGRVEAQLP